MSTDFSNWSITEERGEGPAFLLAHRGVSIVLTRGNSTIAAQTVVLTPANQPSQREGDAGQSGKQEYVVIGLSSLNIRRGDRFSHNPVTANALNFEVISVDKTLPNMVQARAMLVS